MAEIDNTKRCGMTKTERKTALAVREILVERFPRCFCGKGLPKRPLKIGIYKDIRAAARDISVRQLRLALKDYTQGRTYRRALVVGADRVDLEGFPAGTVDADTAAWAAAKVRCSDVRPRPRTKNMSALLEASPC